MKIILMMKNLHTYIPIHNCSLQSFSQDYNLFSHITYAVCLNFIQEWWDLQFKVDSEQQIFCETVYLRGNLRRKYMMSDPKGLNSGLTSNKPTHYLLRVHHLTFFLTNAYFVNGNTQLLSDLIDNQFYPSAERIWSCIGLNNAGKWVCQRFTEDADFDKKIIFSDEAQQAKLSHLGHRKPARIH